MARFGSTRYLGALLLSASTWGCAASSVDRGAALYADRNYVAAAELFEHTEARLDHESASESARYALYRGATLLALGDVARARVWLAKAASAAQRDRDVLSEDERKILASAWRSHALVVARSNDAGASGATPATPTAVSFGGL